MRRAFRIGFLSAVFAAALAFAGALAEAQDAASDPSTTEGVINAAALRPMPKGASVSVRPWDDAPDNLRIAREIEDQLRQRGHALTTNPQMVLSFSVSDQPGRWSPGAGRQMIELHGTQGSSGEEDNMRAQLNLYSSERGGLFNEGRADGIERSVYTLEMTLDAREGGQRLWQGEATARMGRTEGSQLVKQLIPPLLDAMGKTVRNQPFGLK
jgi:hypothetical protein